MLDVNGWQKIVDNGQWTTDNGLGREPRHDQERLLSIALAISVLIVGLSTKTSAQETEDLKDTAPIDLKAVWKKVVEVNKVWLDPRPESLSYKIVSGSPPPAQPETIQQVWVSGKKARWEMESDDGPQRLEYTLIVTPERSEYLRGPNALSGRRVNQQTLNPLRQGVTWSTAIHSLAQSGLPDDAKVISDTKDDNSRIVVLETKLGGRRSSVGLGLYHQFYGSSRRPLGNTKLTLRLPDHVLLREELDDGTVIEYGPEFLKAGDGLAPSSSRYVSELPNGGQWILSAQFQVVDGAWLLKTAQNTRDQVVVKQMTVQDVSTLPISDEKFALTKKD